MFDFRNWLISLWLMMIFLISQAKSEQHEIVERIRAQYKQCAKIYLYEPKVIESRDGYKLFAADLIKLEPQASPERLSSLARATSSIPVNNCVLRGNRHFLEHQNFLKELKVNTVVNTDSLVNASSYGKHRLNYLYYPMDAIAYPRGESKKSLLKALYTLSEATPERKTYIGCFFGKHRTSLVVGIYQFLQIYAQDSKMICQNYGTSLDPAFIQMKEIAGKGLLTYDLPKAFENFYRDFAKSVCEESSKEFLDKR
ncbi:MAG: hypothetical protein SFT81_05090 [Candidatus Caenarcaniphilales bacterium]|nr:hypothetical protein [Candidatus Caenarcaniphilales bacterium]